MNRLSKGFYHRNAPDILRRLTAHGIERILIFLHLLLHALPHHCHHTGETDQCRYHADEPDLPVKRKYQHQESYGCHRCDRLIRKVMGDIGFRSGRGIIDDPSDLAGSVFIENP